MSHRVTTETQIKDKAILTQACKTAGISFVDQGQSMVRFTSGKLNNASLDLKTGRITGDTDHGHTEGSLSALKQMYGEALYRDEAHRQGITVESRSMNAAGEIVLMCSMG